MFWCDLEVFSAGGIVLWNTRADRHHLLLQLETSLLTLPNRRMCWPNPWTCVRLNSEIWKDNWGMKTLWGFLSCSLLLKPLLFCFVKDGVIVVLIAANVCSASIASRLGIGYIVVCRRVHRSVCERVHSLPSTKGNEIFAACNIIVMWLSRVLQRI